MNTSTWDCYFRAAWIIIAQGEELTMFFQQGDAHTSGDSCVFPSHPCTSGITPFSVVWRWVCFESVYCLSVLRKLFFGERTVIISFCFVVWIYQINIKTLYFGLLLHCFQDNLCSQKSKLQKFIIKKSDWNAKKLSQKISSNTCVHEWVLADSKWKQNNFKTCLNIFYKSTSTL